MCWVDWDECLMETMGKFQVSGLKFQVVVGLKTGVGSPKFYVVLRVCC